MYAVIVTGGKQYRVAKGDTVYVEKLDAKKGDKVTFKNVVFVGGKSVKVGTPTVSGASVEGSVVKQGKQKKVTLFRYHAKKGHHSKKGHRQPYTEVKVTSVNA